MKLVWDENAWEDYLWWQTQDRKLLKRINALIQDIARNGNEGIGKPEPLTEEEWAMLRFFDHRSPASVALRNIADVTPPLLLQ